MADCVQADVSIPQQIYSFIEADQLLTLLLCIQKLKVVLAVSVRVKTSHQ